MTDYSFFYPNLLSGSYDYSQASSVDLGIQFTANSACQIAGYYFYIGGSGSTTGSDYSARLYSTTDGTTGTLISGSSVTGSGTLTAGAWSRLALSTPVTLTKGTTYVAVVTFGGSGGGHYRQGDAYWYAGDPGAAGVTSGPVTAPGSSALGNNQQAYNIPSSGGITATGNYGKWFGVDVQIQNLSTGSVNLAPAAQTITVWPFGFTPSKAHYAYMGGYTDHGSIASAEAWAQAQGVPATAGFMLAYNWGQQWQGTAGTSVQEVQVSYASFLGQYPGPRCLSIAMTKSQSESDLSSALTASNTLTQGCHDANQASATACANNSVQFIRMAWEPNNLLAILLFRLSCFSSRPPPLDANVACQPRPWIGFRRGPSIPFG